MNGLFRRLAKQANGLATTLHAPARLPFHDAPSATEALESANATMSAEAPSPIVAMPAQSRPTAPYVPETPELPGDSTTSSAAGPSVSAAPTAREATKATPALNRSDDAPQQAANASRAPRPARRARISTSAQEIFAPTAQQIATEAPSRPPPATERPTADTTPPESTAEAIEDTATSEFPPTLLPPHADAARVASITTRTRPQTAERNAGRAQTSAGESPNEVHVHIGRIEVTAIQESAPKPRAKRNGRAPMSLDEYLAKRQRGSS